MKKEVKNIFNQSYELHQSKVDPAAIWEAIELEKKRKKRKWILWWLIGPSLLVMALAAYSFFGVEVNRSENIVSEKIVKHHIVVEETTDLSANENSDKINLTSVNEITVDVEELGKEIESKKTKVSADKERVNLNSNTTKIATKEKSLPSKSINRPTATTQESKLVSPNLFQKSSIVVDGIHMNESENRDTRISVPVSSRGDENSEEVNGTPISVPIEKVKMLGQSNIALLNPSSAIPCSLALCTKQDMNRDELIEKVDDASKESKRIKMYAAVLGAAGLFSDKYIDGDSDLLTFRDEVENPLESFGSQLSVGFKSGNFGLETGLNYLRTNRIMQWSNKYFGDANGKFLYPHDPSRFNASLLMQEGFADSLQVFYYDRNLRKYNESHTVSIPLTVSYSHSIKSFDLGVYVGTAIHLVQKNNNDILNLDSELVDQRMSTEIKRNPDWVTGVFIDYRLIDNLSLISNLGLRLRKTQELDLGIQTKFYTLGLGLKYHLN